MLLRNDLATTHPPVGNFRCTAEALDFRSLCPPCRRVRASRTHSGLRLTLGLGLGIEDALGRAPDPGSRTGAPATLDLAPPTPPRFLIAMVSVACNLSAKIDLPLPVAEPSIVRRRCRVCDHTQRWRRGKPGLYPLRVTSDYYTMGRSS